MNEKRIREKVGNLIKENEMKAGEYYRI